MKTTAISVLGTQKDAHGGAGPARYLKWALFACKCAAEDLLRGEH